MIFNNISFLILLILAVHGFGQDMPENSADPRLFDEADPLRLTIETDLISLLSDRSGRREEQDVIIKLKFGNTVQSFPGNITTRGNFRRDSANCPFPPLRIIFKKSRIENTFFEGNNKIKIVTHCNPEFPVFEQYVLREYLAYRIYNFLTTKSFRVRLADITYRDTRSAIKPFTKQAFLIEDIDEVAERNQMEEFEGNVTPENLEKDNIIRLSLFQYMIGNTDWIVDLSKNLKFISDGNRYFAVPYDFDYSALVDTDYSLGTTRSILSRPVRKYKGPCYPAEDIIEIAGEFKNKRKEFRKLINRQKRLDYKSSTHMKNYLDDFFYILKSPERIRNEILSVCP